MQLWPLQPPAPDLSAPRCVKTTPEIPDPSIPCENCSICEGAGRGWPELLERQGSNVQRHRKTWRAAVAFVWLTPTLFLVSNPCQLNSFCPPRPSLHLTTSYSQHPGPNGLLDRTLGLDVGKKSSPWGTQVDARSQMKA